ncbi:TetR/AcrR family transcriptional regulator [Tardiphaga alba]|uniref:TetR/AcrR family transcriptional regulator n=1 Tax=Tardiphaga alba TaxID=340268 RepID=A0ABX8A9C2_9BRAD|nr:TetR/AcrR family transcriptional regulator [Tardiphaga alba]QUS39862.1 TetR/AcrR family transcriptional regulator [Tardiphaga alba]
MAKKMITPGHDLLLRVNQAFLDHGYAGLSMVGLARICGFTQRALYYYFSNKEEAFRAAVQFRNEQAIATAIAAGTALRQEGASALDIVACVVDLRYSETRQMLTQSPHTIELTAEAFRRCRDIVVRTSADFQTALEKLVADLQSQHRLELTGRFTAAEIAQALADGGRAVSQAIPLTDANDCSARYRQTCEFVLYGCAAYPSSTEPVMSAAR